MIDYILKANKRIIFVLFISVWITSCKQLEIPKSSPIITQQATPCYGSCPVYTLSIYDNRTVTLRAENFLPLQGNHIARMNQKQFDALIDLINSKIFDFKNQYTADISDQPTVYLSFNHQGRTKQIEDYYGAPQELKALEAEIFKLIYSLKWKKAR